MPQTLLLTTSTEGLQPLGTAAQRSHELVTGALRQRLGGEYTELFAEPIAAAHGDRIDWHASIGGEVMRMADLPEPERAALRDRLGQMTRAIVAEADNLSSSAASGDQRLGEALRNAVEVPSEDMIRVVRRTDGDFPVLVHWGWVNGERRAVRGVLTGMIPRTQPLSTVQSGPVAGLWANPLWGWLIWLGWLLLALLLGLILYLMIHPCGLAPLGPDHCRKDPAALSAAYSEQDALIDRIDRLQHEIALTGRACTPTIPILPAGEAPERKGGLWLDPWREIRRLAGLGDAEYTALGTRHRDRK